jgi:hypothetical protein
VPVEKKPSILIEKKAIAPLEKSTSIGSVGAKVTYTRPDSLRPGTVEKIVQQFETNDFSAKEEQEERRRAANPILYDTLLEFVSDDDNDSNQQMRKLKPGAFLSNSDEHAHLFLAPQGGERANESRAEPEEDEEEMVVRHALLMHCKSLKGLPSIVPDSENYSVSLENMMLETKIPDFKEIPKVEEEPIVAIPPTLEDANQQQHKENPAPDASAVNEYSQVAQRDSASLPALQSNPSFTDHAPEPAHVHATLEHLHQQAATSIAEHLSNESGVDLDSRGSQPIASSLSVHAEPQRETLSSFLAEEQRRQQQQLSAAQSSQPVSSQQAQYSVESSAQSNNNMNTFDTVSPVLEAFYGTKARQPSGVTFSEDANANEASGPSLAKVSEPQPNKKYESLFLSS